jgi:hypothetical protein
MHRFLTQHQLPWILLWIGLAFLILSLGVLIRTSWGQSHPLRKCAGLSLLAHLLLLCYATTVQIVTATGGVSHNINVTLVDGTEDGSDDPQAVIADDPASASSSDDSATTDSPTDVLPKGKSDFVPVQKPTQPIVSEPVETPPHEISKARPIAPPPLLEVAKTDPKTNPSADPPVEPPHPEATAKSEAPAAPQPVASQHKSPDPPPPATSVVDSKPTEKSTEPLPAVDAAAPLPRLPDPPQTSNDAQWLSGEPAGSASHLTPPSTQGPLTAADSAPSSKTTPAPSVAASTSPLVEVASAPIASRAVPEIYSDRVAPDRAELVRRRGGTAESESAVQTALQWLAANQSADGRWDADKFGAGHEMAVLGQDRQGAGAHADTGMTGLALLAFLGAGNTHKQGPYSKTVQRGLEFLISVQGKDGNLAGEAETYAYMYSHGMATFALCEAYAMTGDKRLEPAVKSAINYTLNGQIKSTGGWRYRQIESPGEKGDTSQLGWQWMALKSAEVAGIEIPASAREGVIKFLGTVSTSAKGGKASYRPGERPTRTMTAEALACRQFLGMPRENPAGDEAADFLMEELPGSGKVNLYYWYYGTLSMYQLQGPHWDRWNQAMQNTLVRKQRVDGDFAGSWDPECIWGGYGGRVYSTAVSALCLEVYYRYLPIYRSTQDRLSARPSP